MINVHQLFSIPLTVQKRRVPHLGLLPFLLSTTDLLFISGALWMLFVCATVGCHLDCPCTVFVAINFPPLMLSAVHMALSFLCHNDIYDLTASLLSEVCHDIKVEPPLQSLTSDVMCSSSAGISDIHVFNSPALFYQSTSLGAMYCQHEAENIVLRRRVYGRLSMASSPHWSIPPH